MPDGLTSSPSRPAEVIPRFLILCSPKADFNKFGGNVWTKSRPKEVRCDDLNRGVVARRSGVLGDLLRKNPSKLIRIDGSEVNVHLNDAFHIEGFDAGEGCGDADG